MRRLAAITALSTSVFADNATEPRDISQDGIQTAFRILQKEYIRSNVLTFDELNRAALMGLLQRLDYGAELIPQKLTEVPNALKGVQVELLMPQTGYLRPQAFTGVEAEELEQHLKKFSAAGVTHLILDLRTPSPPGDFNVVASMLGLFAAKDEVLFKMKQMGQDRAEAEVNRRTPVWTHKLLVLIDDETNNLGETLAAVLRQRKQALLIGSPTRGGAVRYETVPVDAGWYLRFARAEVLLADDSSVFKKGLQPDFVVRLETSAKHQAFEASLKKDVRSVVNDQPRKRFNEAALVKHQNPELDAYIRRSTGEPLSEETPKTHDIVIQRAMDLITARGVFESTRLDWKRPAAAAEPQALKATPVNP